VGGGATHGNAFEGGGRLSCMHLQIWRMAAAGSLLARAHGPILVHTWLVAAIRTVTHAVVHLAELECPMGSIQA
jgi:hypothetical protein